MDLIVTAVWIIVVLCGIMWVLDNTPIGKPIKSLLAGYVERNYPKVKNAKLIKDLPPDVQKRLNEKPKKHKGRH